MRISPDGKLLSWLAAVDGVLNVWVAPTEKLPEAKAITAEKTRPIRQYFWAFDGKHLLYLQDKAGDENYHLYRVDVASAEVKDLTPIEGARVEVHGVSERKPGSIMVGINDRDPQVFDLYEIDLSTGQRALRVKNEQGFAGFYVDHDFDVRFGQKLAPDGSSILFSFLPETQSFREYDRIGADDLLTTNVIGFDKQGQSYYAVDSRERNTSALFKVNVKTKHKELIYADPRVDVSDVLLHPTEHRVQAVQVNYDKPRWVAIDAKVKQDLEGISKLADGVPSVESRTLDDTSWIVRMNLDDASSKYFLWDTRRKAGELLFSARPTLDEQPLVKMHPTIIPSRDGRELVSYLSLPKHADANADGAPEQVVPMVLLVHGGPWGRDEWGLDPLHQLLANRGYAVLSVNFRGSTGFGKDFINAGNKEWGKKMHDDLLDAVRWAIEKNVAPRDKICIMGGSYGGYATLAGLTLTPDVFACGVDIVGPSNIVTLLETIPPYWAPMISLFHSRVGDPTTEEGRRALLEVSPLSHVEKIKKPLLIGQGANDPRVKKSESDQIVKAMQAKNIPVSYVVFPDEGHGFARPENDIAFFAVTEAFLSVHLGGWFQPIAPSELAASSMQIEAGKQWLPGLSPDPAR